MRNRNEDSIGWYQVPDRPRLHRFWNGERWVGAAADDYAVRGTVLTTQSPPLPA